MSTTPNGLPAGWASAVLGELCDLNPKHSKELPDTTEVSFAPMAAVDDVHGELATIDVRPLDGVRTGYTHFADGDVLFAKITPCMENGKAAIARGLKNGLGCGSTEFFVLRSRGGVVAKFLHRFLRQETYRNEARAAMTGVVGQARVPREFLEQTELPVPPLAEQNRIVAEIAELTARSRRAKEALDAVPPLLNQLRQSILAAAFRGDLTADWRVKNPGVEPADTLIARIRAERRARWEAVELAKLAAKGKRPADDKWKSKYPAPAEAETSGMPDLPEGWSWLSLAELSWDAGYGTSVKCSYEGTGEAVLSVTRRPC